MCFELRMFSSPPFIPYETRQISLIWVMFFFMFNYSALSPKLYTISKYPNVAQIDITMSSFVLKTYF